MKWLKKHGTIAGISKLNDFLVSFCFKSMMVIGVSLADLLLRGIKVRDSQLLAYQSYFTNVISRRHWGNANKIFLIMLCNCFTKFLEMDPAYRVCFEDILNEIYVQENQKFPLHK